MDHRLPGKNITIVLYFHTDNNLNKKKIEKKKRKEKKKREICFIGIK